MRNIFPLFVVSLWYSELYVQWEAMKEEHFVTDQVMLIALAQS